MAGGKGEKNIPGGGGKTVLMRKKYQKRNAKVAPLIPFGSETETFKGNKTSPSQTVPEPAKNEYNEQVRAQHTNGARGVPRCGALS